MSKCSKCGYEMSLNSKFCDNCGAKAEDITAPITAQNTANGVNMQANSAQQETPNKGGQSGPVSGGPLPAQGRYESAPAPNIPNAPLAPQQAYQPQQQPMQQPVQQPMQQPMQQPVQQPMQQPVQQPMQQPVQQPMQQQPMQQPVQQPMQQPMQQQYQQPMRKQMPVQNQYAGAGVATKKKGNNPLVFVGIGVGALIVIAILITLVSSLFSGGSDDPNVGLWKAEEITMMGMSMNPEDIYPDGITLELKSNGKCILTMDGDDYSADYEIDGTSFKMLDGGEEFPGTIIGNVIEITNLLDMGIDIKFVKEGGSEQSDAGEEDVTNENDLTGGTQGASDFIAPGYGTEQTVPVETLSNPSNWYGIVNISNYVGNDDISGEYEAWGYIGSDELGNFFELYVNGPVDSGFESDLMSFNIELHDYSFFPIVDEYAWLYGGATLKEEDNTWYVPSITNGVLSASYNYDYNGESFIIDFAIAQIAGSGAPAVSGGSNDTAGNDNEAAPEPAPAPTPAAASLTMEELKQIYNAILALEIDEKFSLSYEDIKDRFFGGVEGNITNENETFRSYQWISIEAETSLLNVSFNIDEDTGELTYKSMSINNIPLD